ncbi:MAG: hypothetical protein ABSA40_09005 [Candidatus Dormibacteria bacterium]
MAGLIALITLIVIAGGIGAVLWWASDLPPTRPRPRSRYRGPIFMDTHRRLREPRDRER